MAILLVLTKPRKMWMVADYNAAILLHMLFLSVASPVVELFLHCHNFRAIDYSHLDGALILRPAVVQEKMSEIRWCALPCKGDALVCVVKRPT